MIISIKENLNGSRSNQSITPETIPDGWAVVPSDMEIPDTFPFINATFENINGIMTVTRMTSGAFPVFPEKSAEHKRESCYKTGTYDGLTFSFVAYAGNDMTVDEAVTMWSRYTAEGDSEKAAEISAAISVTKSAVRAAYPD